MADKVVGTLFSVDPVFNFLSGKARKTMVRNMGAPKLIETLPIPKSIEMLLAYPPITYLSTSLV